MWSNADRAQTPGCADSTQLSVLQEPLRMLGSVAAAPCCVSWRQRRRQAGHCACSVIPECKLHLHHCFAVITAALKAVQAIPKRSALRLVACRKDCVLPHLYSARNAELQAWQPREGPQTVLKEPCRHRRRCCPPPLPQTPVQAAKQTIYAGGGGWRWHHRCRHRTLPGCQRGTPIGT